MGGWLCWIFRAPLTGWLKCGRPGSGAVCNGGGWHGAILLGSGSMGGGWWLISGEVKRTHTVTLGRIVWLGRGLLARMSSATMMWWEGWRVPLSRWLGIRWMAAVGRGSCRRIVVVSGKWGSGIVGSP